MDVGSLVWIPDSVDGFALSRLVDISHDGLILSPLKQPNTQVSVGFDEVYPAIEESRPPVDDACNMMFLNEATLLQNCRLLYERKQIYSFAGVVLIAVNPYEDIEGLYSAARVAEYAGRSLGTRPPHIFALAERARMEMRRSGESQSIVVSGESGSGKTETQKAVLGYICRDGHASSIQQRILDVNPILESFGNAKTLRNRNSSRFGKLIEVRYKKQEVVGGFICHYLLEKSRVSTQLGDERNYHIFYQLIAGADDLLFGRLQLAPPQQFQYLRSCPQFFARDDASLRCSRNTHPLLSDPHLDDCQQFARVNDALRGTGMDNKKIDGIFEIVAAVLHLGNVDFEEDVGDQRGGCRVTSSSEASLSTCASLLGVDVPELRVTLTARVMQPTRGGAKGTLIRVPLKAGEARAARDCMARNVYSRLFDWIVTAVNNSIPSTDSQSFIGVLDIAGFEFFKRNSFEQFCINYCNEKLQQFFTSRILVEEQSLYAREGLRLPHISHLDNTACIQLIEAPKTGLLSLLDEESKMPRPSVSNFTQAAHTRHANNVRLDKPRNATRKEYRGMRDEEGLLVRHFAGTVCYETAEFIQKNSDTMHTSLTMMLEESRHSIIRQLFPSTAHSNISRLRSTSIGANLKTQLNELIQRLQKTGTHFVRCIKPNDEMLPGRFIGASVLAQLECAGMSPVLELMHAGFPNRLPFSQLFDVYSPRLPPSLSSLDARMFTKCLFRVVGILPGEFEFGSSKLFLRRGTFAKFDKLMSGSESEISGIIDRARRVLVGMRWRSAQYAAWSAIKLSRKIRLRTDAIINIQKYTRGFLSRKRIRPRLDLLHQVLFLQKSGEPISDELAMQIEAAIDSIKDLRVPMDECVSAVQECKRGIHKYAIEREELEKQKQEEEKRKREEALEEERRWRRKVEEERKKEIERAEKERQEQEEKQKQEEEMRNKEKIQQEMNKLDKTVKEPTAIVAPTTPAPTGITGWKYAELRDTINTSTDVQLILACKNEFHRRLRLYNEWKEKNSRAPRPTLVAKAPVAPHIAPCGGAVRLDPSKGHRFFKVETVERNGQKGLAYKHFMGEWIHRQIDVRPGQKAVILRSGKDDELMEHRALSHTGHTRQKGAEIEGREFEAVWTHFGGPVNWKP